MKFTALLIAALSALFLSSCNTMEGLGRDMQKAGSSMERSAASR
jgi:entericidin B